MQRWPLIVTKLIDHAATNYPHREIISLAVEGGIHRSNWGEVAGRSKRLAAWLGAQGIGLGDRVATIAWNTYRHVEAWYGVAGAGAVVHPVNPRLFPEQIIYIINHAADRVLLVDLSFIPLLEQIAPKLKTIEKIVVLTDEAHMPDTSLDGLCYETVLAQTEPLIEWVSVGEDDGSGLSYTSGTTGNPKGVLYTHRSNVLVSMAISQVDQLALSGRSVILPVVPFYHANGWALPWASAMVGAKLVLAGAYTDSDTIRRLIIEESVTIAGAVPTIWQGMLQQIDREGGDLGVLERAVVGGSAAPLTLIERLERQYGLVVINSWGMTETSPLGTLGMLCGSIASRPYEDQADYKLKKGRPAFGIELKVTDEVGNALARDGVTPGLLKVRGPWVVDRYYGSDADVCDQDGFFDTGDIGTLDALGYLQLTDRAKDVVKSGGEWISSIDLENLAMGCAGVAEAAVVAIPHPKWDERPLMIIREIPGANLTAADVYAFLEGKIARWWTPDAIVFTDDIPHTATGKILKSALREQYRDFKPSAEAPRPRGIVQS